MGKLEQVEEIKGRYKRIVRDKNVASVVLKELLIALLLELDNILSDDDMSVKASRRKVVIRINRTLDEIERYSP